MKNNRIDSEKIAGPLRSGMLPEAYAYPAEMRSTRDRLRRRLYLVRKHAELESHIRNTRMQYNAPAFEKRIHRVANRDGISERFADPMMRASIDVDTKLLEALQEQIVSIEQQVAAQAKGHDPGALALLRTIPGIGPTLGMTLLYEIGDIDRFPKVGNFISYARLVKCMHESPGKRSRSRHSKVGNAYLRWAFGEAACFFLRANPRGQKWHEKLVSKYGRCKAMSDHSREYSGRSVWAGWHTRC